MDRTLPVTVRPRSALALAVLLVLCWLAVPPAARAASLLSQGKAATASSSEGAGTPASAAVDGDAGTRWSSAFADPAHADPQWLQVDLGATATITQVTLNWESAYATAFEIQVSDDAANWHPVYSTTTGAGGVQTLSVSGSGRYVRMYGTHRVGGYGYSLWEFQVSGSFGGTTPAGPGVVKVTGSQGNWQLTVDGAPYVVKGLTWGPPVGEAATRMPELHEAGVNTVRTWGTDATTQPLLDAAAANGLKVINGFWLQPGGGPGSGGCVDYLTDTTYKNTMLGEIQRWVTQYRDHAGVLMWNVGNESILGMQNCYSGTQLEQERVAYTQFVEQAAQAIHAIDANHPVTSTDAWTGAWPYYKAYAPSLDLYSVNAYKQVCQVKQDWNAGGYTKPYIVTETGPAGEWEVPNDANGVPAEPTDVQKRDGYVNAWNCILGHPGVALGATLFHYGSEGDFGGVWFNITTGNEKRLSWYAVRKLYSGRTDGNTPPVIGSMNLSRTTDVPAGGTFTLTADVADPDGDPITYTMGYNSKYINGAGGLIPAQFTGGGPFTVTAPSALGVWKLYLYARDGHGNVGIETRSLRVVAPPVSGTNLARGAVTTASSYQADGPGAPYPPQAATDGDANTRWASDWSDPQWLQVDLGHSQSFDHVQLIWESAYGKAYEIQVSDDGTTWHSVYTTTTGDGGVDDLAISGTGRYVRMSATQRGTTYGYSLYEFGVYRT
ncbi:discoidin domain-containing protein [Amycolatopsis saalfeldensis]|uniref:Glycosyl hydrolases family 2, TIM barrel domain n=1 Tax=Amycolatopsis saalfeldensis TaxID=394193 RepID=A0A1H8YFY3_9PSEU|nr:Glycosyl hydrolases family 2, TIM barrel domain [Amycolatopsis saalfeldensis]